MHRVYISSGTSPTPKLRKTLLTVAGIVVAVTSLGCTESLESDVGCPLLCPNQSLELREVVLDAVEFDATIGGFPPVGAASFFTLANSGDTLESHVVIRFDSLPNTYVLGGVTNNITAVDSTILRVFLDTTGTRARADVTVELYDVDTTAAETDFAAIRALFRPDRFIASRTIASHLIRDTLDIDFPPAVLLTKILSPGRRLRIGLRVRSDSTVRIVPISANQDLFPRLRFDPAPANPDFNVVDRSPRSHTPLDNQSVAVNYTDYQVPGRGQFPLVRNTVGLDTAGVFRDSLLVAGGVEGRRIYMRFNVPDSILNSSIIRATLIMQKRASPDYGVRDTTALVPKAVFATALVPPSRAVMVSDTFFIFPMPSQRLEPRTTGEVRFDVVNFARNWTTDTKAQIPHALMLRVGLEERSFQEFHFYSTLGPTALKPRLRITFVPRQQLGPP